MYKNKLSLFAVIFSAIQLLAGCSTVSSLTDKVSDIHLWPFGDKKQNEVSYHPENSVEYRCSNGKQFFIRMQDAGNTVWLILPDRELALSKKSDLHFSNGITTLSLEKDGALEVSSNTVYTSCNPFVANATSTTK